MKIAALVHGEWTCDEKRLNPVCHGSLIPKIYENGKDFREFLKDFMSTYRTLSTSITNYTIAHRKVRIQTARNHHIKNKK